jgi:hypothetical protein
LVLLASERETDQRRGERKRVSSDFGIGHGKKRQCRGEENKEEVPSERGLSETGRVDREREVEKAEEIRRVGECERK